MVNPVAGQLIGDVISDGSNRLRNQLADPSDNSLFTQARRAVCDAYASAPGQLVSGIGGQAAAGYACGPYWDQQGTDAPVEQPPFTGGQCPVNYRVTVTANFTFDGESETRTNSSTGRGPVSGLEAVFSNNGNSVAIFPVGADGRFSVAAISQNLGTGRTYDGAFIVSAVRTDGQPDNCGDPPPVLQPGPNNPGTPPGTPQTRPVGDTPVNFDIDIGVDASLNPVFKVNTNIGGIQFAPEIVLAPGPNPPVLPQVPDPPATEGPPIDLPPGGGEEEPPEDPQDEETGTETIGYRWQFTSIPTGIGVINGTNPKVYPFILGNIRLKCRTQTGSTFWLTNVEIDSESGAVIRPDESLKVTGFAIQSNPDYNAIRITPLKKNKVREG